MPFSKRRFRREIEKVVYPSAVHSFIEAVFILLGVSKTALDNTSTQTKAGIAQRRPD